MDGKDNMAPLIEIRKEFLSIYLYFTIGNIMIVQDDKS